MIDDQLNWVIILHKIMFLKIGKIVHFDRTFVSKSRGIGWHRRLAYEHSDLISQLVLIVVFYSYLSMRWWPVENQQRLDVAIMTSRLRHNALTKLN